MDYAKLGEEIGHCILGLAEELDLDAALVGGV